MDRLPFLIVGCFIVLLIGHFIKILSFSKGWPLCKLLLFCHIVFLFFLMALSPLMIFATWDSIYGDFYFPYLFVPGCQIYYYFFENIVKLFTSQIINRLVASILTIIILPGITGLVLGGVIWFIIGLIFDFFLWVFRRICGRRG